MFESVLISYDFSDDSQYVVSCLSKISHIREVILLHIIQSRYLVKKPDTINPDMDYARLRLEEVRKLIGIPPSRIRVIIEEISGGTVAAGINHVANREGASLIMMGRRGRGIIETLLIGSTASDLLKYGTKNLLLIHPPGTDNEVPISRRSCPDLLSAPTICTDFSAPSIETICIDKIITKRTVTLFHVITTGDSNEEISSYQESAITKLNILKEELSPYAQDIRIATATGDAAQEILTYSEQTDISIIVMKSKGDKGVILNLLGRTTESVARFTQKPVLVLRQDEEIVCDQ